MISTISHAATFADSLKRVLKPQGVPHLKSRDTAARILGQRDWRSLQATGKVLAGREDVEARLRTELSAYPGIDAEAVVAKLLPPEGQAGRGRTPAKVVEHVLRRFGEDASPERCAKIADVIAGVAGKKGHERRDPVVDAIRKGQKDNQEDFHDRGPNPYDLAFLMMSEIDHPYEPDWMDAILRRMEGPAAMLRRNEGYASGTVTFTGARSGMLELQDRLRDLPASNHPGLRKLSGDMQHGTWPFVSLCALHLASASFTEDYHRIRKVNDKEELDGWDQGWTREMFDRQHFVGVTEAFGDSVSYRLWNLLPDQMSRLIDRAIAILPDLLDAMGDLPDVAPHGLTLDEAQRERAVPDQRPSRQWTPRWRMMSVNDQGTWGFCVMDFEHDDEPTTWVRTVEDPNDALLDAFPGIGREPGSEWIVVGRGEERDEIVPQSIARITTQDVKGERSEHMWAPNRPVYRIRLHEVAVSAEADGTKKHARAVLGSALYTLCSERLYDYAMMMTGCVVRIAFSGTPKGAADVAQDVRRMIYEHIGMPTQGNLRTINIEPLRGYSEGDWLVRHHRGWIQPC